MIHFFIDLALKFKYPVQ